MGEAAADVGGDFENAAYDQGKGEPGAVAKELDGKVERYEGEEGGEDNCTGEGGVVVVKDDSGVRGGHVAD